MYSNNENFRLTGGSDDDSNSKEQQNRPTTKRVYIQDPEQDLLLDLFVRVRWRGRGVNYGT